MTPQPGAMPSLGACVPNRDGTIDRGAAADRARRDADFYAGTNRTVDLVAVDRPACTTCRCRARRHGRRDRSGRPGLAVVRAVVSGGPVRRRCRQRARRHLPPGRDRAVARRHGVARRDARLPARRSSPTPRRSRCCASRCKTARATPTPQALVATIVDGLPLQGSDEVDVDVALGARARRAVRAVLADPARAHRRDPHAVDRYADHQQAHDAVHVRMLRRGRARREQRRRAERRLHRLPRICGASRWEETP